MKALLYVIKHRILIMLCPILHGGHQWAGPMYDGTPAGCTRCLQFKDKNIKNKEIVELFSKREEALRRDGRAV